MKKLEELLEAIRNYTIEGDSDVKVVGLTLDSREVKQGYLFAALKGSVVDGHQYIDAAINAGARVVLCEELPENLSEKVTYVKVDEASAALGYLASAYYNYPSKELKLIGVTGTNGKTSVTTLLYKCYLNLGHKSGLLSTIKYAVNGKETASTHTTPNAVRINELLREMVDAGCAYAFMEVSSHALHQNRVTGLDFDGAVFTNITHDHLDYHKTFKDYLYTKKLLFDGLKSSAFALVNKDDKNSKVMVQNCKGSKYTFSLKSMSDFKAKIIESDFSGMLTKIGDTEVWLNLVGEFNAYNVLAVYGVAFLMGADHLDIITALSAASSVDGRFQNIKEAGITAIVDYAHTPDALQNVLDTINAIRTQNENLITVVGCGGNRDAEKRPVMARIACEHSDRVILTSDNPRFEDPQAIIDEMMKGVSAQNYKKVLQIVNREEAIKTAVQLSQTGDVILIAGKGHETYQEIKGVRSSFDDREIVKTNLKRIKS
jgi:UDP-N-acetylmuramoyl-L-alanyl-D-glutamate--2,6-diaminopimelate ligase